MPNVPKLLVVDDSRTVRTHVRNILVAAGYEVIMAEDGEQALESLQYQPDLMVLDVTMPRLDGYGVVERMRQYGDRFERLPIVFLTSLESRALELLGKEYGAYLHKPVREQELLSVVRSQLELVSQ